MKCDSPGCHYLHEWGGDSDCFSKDDYETAYVTRSGYGIIEANG
jgi:CCR4-NOT transcription complex subunit 4